MISAEEYWIMHGKVTTAPYLHMDRLAVENHIQWLAMGRIKVS